MEAARAVVMTAPAMAEASREAACRVVAVMAATLMEAVPMEEEKMAAPWVVAATAEAPKVAP